MIFSTLDGYTKMDPPINWTSANEEKRNAFRVVIRVKNKQGKHYKQINFRISSNIDITQWVRCDAQNRITNVQPSFLDIKRTSLSPEDQSLFDYIQAWNLIHTRNLSQYIKDFSDIQLYNNHRVPGKPYELSRAFFLKVDI